MPSCTNNSTISGIIVGSDSAINGKRLSFKQNVSVNWDPSIQAGNVIRFDADQIRFTKSIADPSINGTLDLSLAEVVGIVESISKDSSGVTYATVVIHGLMNYPNLLSTISGICGAAGSPGGTDIFFLHPGICGGITWDIEGNRGYVAKPVLQLCPTSDGTFNSIVINYLGYETSDSASASFVSSEVSVGDIRVVDIDTEVPVGWVDTTTEQFLSVTDYPDAYAVYETTYGANEVLTINGTTSFVSSLINSYIRPIDPTTGRGIGLFSQIISTDNYENKITVKHDETGFILWNSNYTQYELREPISSTKKITVTNGQISHFKLPSLQTNLNVLAGNKNEILNFNTKTLLRVKNTNVVSYLPQSIDFNSVEITGKLITPNVQDVDAKLVNLETRLNAIEKILGI